MRTPTIKELLEIKYLFDSIICLCVEGIELCPSEQIIDGVLKEAIKGFNKLKLFTPS